MKPIMEGFYGLPWLMYEPVLVEMERRLHELDLSAYGDSMEKLMGGEDSEYETVSGVAVIKIHGTLSKRPSFWQMLFGGTSYECVERAIRQAAADGNIKGILLDIDSPGGACNGCFEIADVIRSLRSTKPIVALANGVMGSAALCIGTSAGKVVATKGSMVGSLGVILARYDYSKLNDQLGIKVDYITSGEAKSDCYPDQPMSDPERERLQSEVDSLFELFLESVALGRGRSVEEIRASAGDARVFIGQEAIAAGLADRIGTLPEVLAELSGDPNPDLPEPGVEEDDQGNQPEQRSSRYARRIVHSR